MLASVGLGNKFREAAEMILAFSADVEIMLVEVFDESLWHESKIDYI